MEAFKGAIYQHRASPCVYENHRFFVREDIMNKAKILFRTEQNNIGMRIILCCSALANGHEGQ